MGLKTWDQGLKKETKNKYGALFGRVVSITKAPVLMAADGSTVGHEAQMVTTTQLNRCSYGC
jgi:hypothetical protein